MGQLEREMEGELRATKARIAILSTIKAAGLIATFLIAPNMAGTMARILNRSRLNSTRSSLRRLIDAGMIAIENDHARLTAKGERFLCRHTISHKRPSSWDKKWRVVIFDVPERRKSLRNKLRSTLLAIGFRKLQDSVWVYPFDSEDLVTLLKADFHVGKDVLYMIVDKLENDRWLRELFKLQR